MLLIKFMVMTSDLIHFDLSQSTLPQVPYLYISHL